MSAEHTILLLVSAIVTLAFAVCLLAAARGLGTAGQGTGRWVVGDVMVALARSLLLVLAEGVPAWFPALLAHRPLALPAALFVAAIWLHAVALRQAGGHAVGPPWRTALIASGIALATAAAILVIDDPAIRLRLFRALNLAGAVGILVASWPLLRRPWGGVLIAVPLVLSAVFSLIQILRPADFGARPQPTGAGFIVDLIVHLFMATGFMLMLQERLRDRIVELGHTDALTGARNRHGLLPILTHELSVVERSGRPLSVVLFDLDHFKRVNDQHGHNVGDAVLRAFAQYTQKTVRRCDVLGRWGGEEFALLLPETPLAAATALADRIRAHIALGPLAPGLPAFTVSAGVAQSAGSADGTLEDLFKRADERLYAAKRTRNCVVAEG